MPNTNNPLQLVQLNDEHTKSFRAIVADAAYRKITSEGYITLTVEMVARCKVRGLDAYDYSFCHYGELNGDLMRDPEMLFLVLVDKEGVWHVYPHYYRNDYAFGIERECLSYENGELKVNSAMQKDHAEFAAMWLGNLKAQGFVANAAKQPVIKTLKQEEEEG